MAAAADSDGKATILIAGTLVWRGYAVCSALLEFIQDLIALTWPSYAVIFERLCQDVSTSEMFVLTAAGGMSRRLTNRCVRIAEDSVACQCVELRAEVPVAGFLVVVSLEYLYLDSSSIVVWANKEGGDSWVELGKAQHLILAGGLESSQVTDHGWPLRVGTGRLASVLDIAIDGDSDLPDLLTLRFVYFKVERRLLSTSQSSESVFIASTHVLTPELTGTQECTEMTNGVSGSKVGIEHVIRGMESCSAPVLGQRGAVQQTR